MIVGVLLVILFGLIGLFKMPYQLSPDVRQPEISVQTIWVGATPYEIERDIIEEQEKVLKGIPGLEEMESTSSNNFGTITLRFRLGTNLDDALLRVSNKINEVPSYPQNVEKPVISATGAAANPVVWMVLKANEGNPRDIDTYRTFFENEVRQYLERVEGVASLFVGGGTKQEMHIIAHPEKMAAHHVTINEITATLGSENSTISAGTLDVGRRSYRVRTMGQFESPEDIRNTIIRTDGQRRVFVGDVADVEYGYEKRSAYILLNDEKGIAMGIEPESGVNVLELTNRIETAVNRLNEGKLARENIHLKWVYDERPYIKGAIGLVRQNILIGGLLAIIILMVFLRNFSSTVVVSAAIPISIVGTFFFMNLLGRNLNVVSLAGIAFAVGMLVDNAIVVLENIDRHRHAMKESPFGAAYNGTKEVGGAILASTLTTVAVFLPVAFIEEEAGQLFRDIAIAVSCAVMLSLVISITVIPMFSRFLFSLAERNNVQIRGFHPLKRLGHLLGGVGDLVVGGYMLLVRAVLYSWLTRLATVLILTSASVFTFQRLIPRMEYLPTGNRNFIINVLVPPPGLSYEERKNIGDYFFSATSPWLQKEGQDLPGIEPAPGEVNPGIKEMFYVGADQFMFCGAISTQEQQAAKLLPMFMQTIRGIPGMFGISTQAGIFQTRVGGARAVDIDLSGNDINLQVQAAGAMMGMIMGQIPGAQVRPVPSLEILYPEVQVLPDRERVRAAGLTTRDLGVGLDVLMDGRKIGEFKREGEKKIDLVLKAPDVAGATPEELSRLLIATPQGRALPFSALSTFGESAGITQIRHLERNRTISLQVTPPDNVTIEECIQTIEQKTIPGISGMGLLEDVDVRLSGSADKLRETRETMQWDFVLAALITYLLMSALFGNFIYPLIIMFTVPLAGAGGLIGLRVVNLFSNRPVPLDVLTMLGFIILVGIVVNNAILIVSQTLNYIRTYGLAPREAVLECIKTRLRPVYMSALTSVFGMLPLVVATGPGSELYRGLGSVVLGGLLVSTIFTIFVIPSLLMFFLWMEKKHIRRDADTGIPE